MEFRTDMLSEKRLPARAEKSSFSIVYTNETALLGHDRIRVVMEHSFRLSVWYPSSRNFALS